MGFEPARSEVLEKAVVDAKNWAAPWTTGIYGIDEDGPRIAGSATYIRTCGQLLMLTAEHVVEMALTFGRPARASNGQAHEFHDWVFGPPNLDVALIFVGADTSIQPATPSEFAQSSGSVGDQHLFVQGFPKARSRVSAFANGPVSDTLPYITYTSEQDWTGYDQVNHFLLDYPGPEAEQISEAGRPIFLPDPGGLSGCGVWALGRSLAGFTGAGKLVGVAHRHVKDKHALLVTRIESILPFVLETLRRRDAHARWEERGRPLWDDLTDWNLACVAIPRLLA